MVFCCRRGKKLSERLTTNVPGYTEKLLIALKYQLNKNMPCNEYCLGHLSFIYFEDFSQCENPVYIVRTRSRIMMSSQILLNNEVSVFESLFSSEPYPAR